MARTTYQDLLDAGVHFGHLTRKWDPKMAPYIFMERNGIHIIDLNKTMTRLEEAAAANNQIVKSGRKILFVSSKKTSKRHRSRTSKISKYALRNRTLVRWYVNELRDCT